MDDGSFSIDWLYVFVFEGKTTVRQMFLWHGIDMPSYKYRYELVWQALLFFFFFDDNGYS